MNYILIGMMLILLGCFGLLYQEQKKFKLTYYTIPIKEERKNLQHLGRFIMLSDLHNHKYGKQNKKLLDAIDSAKPDFIIIAGDMLIAKPGYSMDTAMAFLEDLSKKYTIYYGNGNHEYRLRIYPKKYGDMYSVYMDKLKELNVKLLINDNTSIKANNEKLVIYGLEIDRQYYKRFEKVTMDDHYLRKVLGEKSDHYSILIAHNPVYFQQYVNWGADLTLSGHVHGGMVRIPGLGGVLSPQIKLFPKYDAGIFKRDEKYMILSRGLGMHTDSNQDTKQGRSSSHRLSYKWLSRAR